MKDVEIKKGPVAISRDFVPRDFQNEKPETECVPLEAVNRREFFKSVGPASGKALTNFLRNFQLNISSITDDLHPKK